MKLTKEEIAMLELKQNVKWSDIYDSEEELINQMMMCKTNSSYPIGKNCVKGYEYIRSFQNTILKGKNLSDKQMIMLKKLAKSIAKHIVIDNQNTTKAKKNIKEK